MANPSSSAAARSAVPSLAPASTAIARAARLLLTDLERGRRIDAGNLRTAMESAFGASDAVGAWDWKTAYDACEAAMVLFLRKFGPAIRANAASSAAMLPMLAKIAGLLPTHTRRSEESQALQQFSTPIPLGLAACAASAITPADRVLEPSAGTGLLAILAELAGGSLVLNELAESRAALLDQVFPGVTVTRFDAAQIDDHLDAAIAPSVVLMNPPFSAIANVDRRMADAALRHVTSALARLCSGGVSSRSPVRTSHRTIRPGVTLSSGFKNAAASCFPPLSMAPSMRSTALRSTRAVVIDKEPAADPGVFPDSPGVAPDAATLLAWVIEHVPPRMPVEASTAVTGARPAIPRTVRAFAMRPSSVPARPEADAVELAYETIGWTPPEGVRLTDAPYEEYGLQSIRISGSQAHPTKLVQSAAMASVAPPKPSYRPHAGEPRRRRPAVGRPA